MALNSRSSDLGLSRSPRVIALCFLTVSLTNSTQAYITRVSANLMLGVGGGGPSNGLAFHLGRRKIILAN